MQGITRFVSILFLSKITHSNMAKVSLAASHLASDTFATLSDCGSASANARLNAQRAFVDCAAGNHAFNVLRNWRQRLNVSHASHTAAANHGVAKRQRHALIRRRVNACLHTIARNICVNEMLIPKRRHLARKVMGRNA
jgi:hypothetical protein